MAEPEWIIDEGETPGSPGAKEVTETARNSGVICSKAAGLPSCPFARCTRSSFGPMLADLLGRSPVDSLAVRKGSIVPDTPLT